MGKTLYACRFELQQEMDIKGIQEAYSSWVTQHYKERYRLNDFLFNLGSHDVPQIPNDHVLQASIYNSSNGAAFTLHWKFPDNNDRSLLWSNEVRAGCFEERCSVEHLISVESLEYKVAPVRLNVGSPRVIRDFCSERIVRIGAMQVKATPYPLPPDDVSTFIDLLASDERKIPIVFLAPYANGDVNSITASSLARNLAGVAIVVNVDETAATWSIAEEIGRALSCFNGAVRIYWPGFRRNDDPRSHRLVLGSQIEQLGTATAIRSIQDTIFEVAAFRFAPDHRISDLIRAVEAEERQRRLQMQKASSEESWAGYAIELDRKLAEANENIQSLETENENLKANQKILFSGSQASHASEATSAVDFASVRDAVERAKALCARIFILPTALASSESSPFRRPNEIFEALRDLDEVAKDWSALKDKRGNGGDLLSHLKSRGWGKRCSMHISDTTKGRDGRHYEFEYAGRRQLFEPHITIGAGDAASCASIHFILDPQVGKIVVGHIGRHLPNTKT